MSAFPEFALLRPWWLWGVAVAVVLGLLLARKRTSLGAWDRAVDPALMAAMAKLGRVAHGARQILWLPPVIAALIALALTGPARDREGGTAFRNLDGIVIAIDLSPSMTGGAGFQDALIAARLIARSAGSRQAALIVFAGDAYVAGALTHDTRALGRTVALLDAETVPDPGSRPERALALAERVLRNAEIVFGDVVLIGDGGGIGPEAMAAARRLSNAGVPVSTVYVPGAAGEGASPPERSILDALAREGGGASGDLADPAPVIAALDQGLRRRLERTDHAVLLREDYGRHLLWFALLPALWLFRRAV